MRNRIYCGLVYIVFFIILAICYCTYLEHIIYYQEQHHLFLFGKDYYDNIVHTEGLFHYINSFIIQFFYYKILGACILSLLLTIIFYCFSQALRRILGSDILIFIAAIPSLYLFFNSMNPDYDLTRVLICLFCSIIVYAISLFFKNVDSIKLFVKMRKPVMISGLIILMIFSSYKFFINYNMGEYRMIMAQKYMNERDWDKVLDQTDSYLEKRNNNQLMHYFRNIALYHKGMLHDHLLDYPMIGGVTNLYLPWKSDSRTSEYGHYLYEELGYINEAIRWETEAMVVWGETASHLINLAEYNILCGKDLVAKFFINKLNKSLFYRAEAKKLEHYMGTGKISGKYNSLIKVADSEINFANVLNIGPELDFICSHSPNNKMAFDYLLCDLLLSNDVMRFVDIIKKYPQFYSKEKYLPILYQEVLYLYILKNGKSEIEQIGYDISEKVVSRFSEYYHLYTSGKIEELKQKFSKSYWYYLHFISPYGNKIITK